jgi:hypothetical protein
MPPRGQSTAICSALPGQLLHKSFDNAVNYPVKAQARLRSIAIDEIRFLMFDQE